MAPESEERTSVKTYVPAYQKEAWGEHAEALDMSRSEFVRTMVQAGRRGFQRGDRGVTGDAIESGSEEPGSTGANPGGDALESVLLGALREEPREFDELVDVVADDLRTEVDAVLSRLEDEGRVEHDRLDGGYTVVEDG